MTGPVKRIMIVDEYAIERRGIREILADTRYQVVAEAADGPTAVELAATQAIDIAVLDFNLPGMNGLETATLLRRSVASVEVLIFSMPLAEDMIIEVLRAGIHGYVSKADPATSLLKALDALSVRKRYYSRGVGEELFERVLNGRRIGPLGLTGREYEIARLIAEGLTSRETAAQLGITKKTVESHRLNLMHKADCKNLADFVRYAIRNDIICA